MLAQSSDKVNTVAVEDERKDGKLADKDIEADFKWRTQKAIRDKLDALRAGNDVVNNVDSVGDDTGPPLVRERIPSGSTWHCTRKKSMPKVTFCDRDKRMCDGYVEMLAKEGYGKCTTQPSAYCITLRDLKTKADDFRCATTVASCMSLRRASITDPLQPSENVSVCTEVGSSAKTPAKTKKKRRR